MYEELVKRLRELASIPKHCDAVEDCSQCTNESICLSFTNKRIIEVATQAADAIEELQRQIDGWIEQERKALINSLHRWISVDERLPEKSDWYLVLTQELEYFVCDYIPSVNQWWALPGDEWIVSVTHWQELPQPPKEETE